MTKPVLLKLRNHETLSEHEMMTCMSHIMEGQYNDIEIAAFLMGLSVRGEAGAELAGAARVLRAKAVSIKAPVNAVDCCGTGGDGANTFNISTAVAITASACGVPVAKHGNRASSSKSGTADVLEALGINLDLPQQKLEEALLKFNFAFLMAPKHHQAMKHVAEVRKTLGVRTIFNLIGPLANPAGTKLQLVGVYDKKWIIPMAQAMNALGTKKAWVVHGEDGLDEITVTGKTYTAILDHGKITEKILTPADFGLPVHPAAELVGATPEENAQALRRVLHGKKSAYRDIVLANTAAVLMIAGKAKTLPSGVEMAENALDSGKALNILESYIAFSKLHGKGT